MEEELIPNEETEHQPEETGGTDETGCSPTAEEPQRMKKCCFCLSYRVGAFLIGTFASVANILSMTLCIVLLLNDDIKVYEYNEQFNYVFMATINGLMLVSNFLIIRGAMRQQQKFVMAWVLVYGVLAFLENVVGFAVFILSIVTHESAWSIVSFFLLLILDGLYVYCIVSAHHYCRSLEGYSVFP